MVHRPALDPSLNLRTQLQLLGEHGSLSGGLAGLELTAVCHVVTLEVVFQWGPHKSHCGERPAEA